MANTPQGIRARIAAIEKQQISTNFCPSQSRDTAFWSSFNTQQPFAYSFCPGFGLTGCQVLVAFNQHGIYVAHYWEEKKGNTMHTRTKDIINFIREGSSETTQEENEDDPNAGKSRMT